MRVPASGTPRRLQILMRMRRRTSRLDDDDGARETVNLGAASAREGAEADFCVHLRALAPQQACDPRASGVCMMFSCHRTNGDVEILASSCDASCAVLKYMTSAFV